MEKLTDLEKKIVTDDYDFLINYANKYFNSLYSRGFGLKYQHKEEILSLFNLSICKAVKSFKPDKGSFRFWCYLHFSCVRNRYFKSLKRDKHIYIGLFQSEADEKCISESELSYNGKFFDDLFGNFTFLSDREKRVIDKYYNFDYTLEFIGVNEGLTRERVRQIKLIAERKIKRYINRERILK